jgi:hypothetical protein
MSSFGESIISGIHGLVCTADNHEQHCHPAWRDDIESGLRKFH